MPLLLLLILLSAVSAAQRVISESSAGTDGTDGTDSMDGTEGSFQMADPKELCRSPNLRDTPPRLRAFYWKPRDEHCENVWPDELAALDDKPVEKYRIFQLSISSPSASRSSSPTWSRERYRLH